MAMLAERKQKQRWCLNPRGKHWSEDANKFGQKMLEKMGWSSGKGLGAKEDGITEHVKIGYKNDAKGIGFKDNGEQWIKHEADFTSLLANLGAGQEATQISVPKSEKSLVKKSQTSRARVHYKKFTRGKDLTHRSEKDLANIFGRKTLERTEIPQIKEPKDVEEESGGKKFGVVTVEAGNMADYFKTKLSSFGKFGKASPTINAQIDEEESESEIGYVGFGFNSKPKEVEKDSFSKVQFVSAQTIEEETITKRKRKLNDLEEAEGSNEKESSKKSRKKKKQLAYDNLGNDVKIDEEMCFDNPCLNDKEDTLENCTKENIVDESSTKKKKLVTFSSPIAEVLNKSDDPIGNEVKVTKKEKKKKKKVLEDGIDNPACEKNDLEVNEIAVPEVNNFEVKTKNPKKKKKKQVQVGVDNLACEEISVNEKNEEIRRYKLKKQAMENGIENPACEENLLDVSEEIKIVEENESKSKKNKKRKRESEFEESTNCSIDTIEEETQASKKNLKSKGIEDVTVEALEQEETPKLKKKKRKSTEGAVEENGITNLACEINTIEEGIANINEEIDNYQNVLENEMNLKKIQKLESNAPVQSILSDGRDNHYRQINRYFSFKTSYKAKHTLKNALTSGTSKIAFQGSNLMEVVGYGAPIQLKAQKNKDIDNSVLDDFVHIK